MTAVGRGSLAAPLTTGPRGSITRLEVLPCGIRLATEAMTDVRSVAVGFWVGTGSARRVRRAGRGVALP